MRSFYLDAHRIAAALADREPALVADQAVVAAFQVEQGTLDFRDSRGYIRFRCNAQAGAHSFCAYAANRIAYTARPIARGPAAHEPWHRRSDRQLVRRQDTLHRVEHA